MTSSSTNSVTVLLVHGAWADGSSWQRVIPYLLAKGVAVVGVQNPTTSLADDVAATRRAIAQVDGPIVLVGHSWGGAVITEAGADPKVKALVFVSAFAPDVGETLGALVGKYDSPPALAHIRDDGAGFLTLGVEGWINDVAQDLPEIEARTLAAIQTPLAASTFSDSFTVAAWANRPTWYIVSGQDRVVSIALEREFAARMKAKTTELPAGHLALLSMPEPVADVILEAVEAVALSDRPGVA